MKELFATSTELVLSGLFLGTLPEQVALWADGMNIVFTNASVQTAPPSTSFLTFTGTPLDSAQSFTLGRRRLYLGTTEGVFRYVGPQTEYESPALLSTQDPAGFYDQILAQAQTRCILVPWGDNIISTDGVNPVKYDENTGTMSDLGGTPFTYARVIWKYFSHLFAADTDLSGRRVYWSALDDPETWTATLSNDAGSNPLRDLDSRIRTGVELGPNQAIYSQDQMVMSRYVGGQDVFYFAPALKGIGAVSPKSIIPHNRFNWGLHHRGIFYTDGIQFEYVDEPKIRKWLHLNVNWTLAANIVGWHDEMNQMMCWSVPISGGTVTVGFGYKTMAFTVLYPGTLFGEEADTFDDCLIGYENSVELQSLGTTEPSYLVTKPMTFGSREVEKVFQMIRFDWTVEGAPTITLSFFNDSADGETAIQEQVYDYADLDRGQYLYILDGGFTANCMTLRIDALEGESFRLGGFQVSGEPGGYNK